MFLSFPWKFCVCIVSDSDEVDQRDVKRVRNRLPYVEKFLIQKLGDGEAAYEMLVCTFIIMHYVHVHVYIMHTFTLQLYFIFFVKVGALKWRKTFGVHGKLQERDFIVIIHSFIYLLDLKYQELDQSMLDIGLAYNHGEDKEQNTIGICFINQYPIILYSLSSLPLSLFFSPLSLSPLYNV